MERFMERFNVGDIICKDKTSVPYTVEDIDVVSSIIPKYKLVEGNFKFWDYCIGWKKLVTPDDALRYGEVLTDDEFKCDILDYTGFQIAETNYHRIRTIQYDNRIFYHKMVNGEVVEFKELTA